MIKESVIPSNQSNERRQLVERLLHEELVRVMPVPPGGVDPARPLTGYGLDSLAAVELQERLAERTAVTVPLADLLAGASLHELASCLLARLADLGSALPQARPATAGAAGGDDRDGEEGPLSYGQRALWFLHRLAPASAAYVIAGVARLAGKVDAARWQACFASLIDRHGALRTTFAELPTGLVQRIGVSAEGAFRVVDLAGADAAAIERRIHAEAFRPFDLERGPVFRATLLAGATGGDLLVVAIHHLVADFWSLAILARELGLLAAGGPAALPPPGPGYLEFVRQERRDLACRGERLWEFWQRTLAGAPPLELPTDRPRPAVETYRGGAVRARLAAATLAAVRDLAAASGTTLFAALLAGLAALLSRYSGQRDLLIGAPAAGRGGGPWAGVVGYFVETLAYRIELPEAAGAAPLLERAHATALAALEHRGFPFALLIERLQPERDPSHPPLLQAMLVLQRSPLPGLAPLAGFALGEPGVHLPLGGELRLESVALRTTAAPFALTLTAAELDGELLLALKYNSDLFDAATAVRLLRHLTRLLAGMGADPRRPLAELDLLDEAERHQVAEWNDTAGGTVPGTARLDELFTARALRMPDAEALVCGAERLTFRELHERSSRLAQLLQRRGVGPESRVAIFLPRTADAIVGLLAVLKAGGAYLALEPGTPKGRLGQVLGQARVALVLTLEDLRRSLPSGRFAILCMDRERDTIAAQPAIAPRSRSGPGNLAYVLHTSGSSGRPKGVMIEHHSVVNLLAALRQTVYRETRPPLRVAVNAPLGFDASVKQWIQLLDGHTLCLVPEDSRGDPARLLALLRRERVDVLDCTPSQLGGLVAAGLLAEDGPRLEIVLVGGEAIPPPLWQRLAAHRRMRFCNVYGPTECTVDTTAAGLGPHLPHPSLGRPLANVQVRLLDRWLNPVPLGATGELVIGGAGLARGYLDQPGATAERFVPDPFSGQPGARLYRSGDLARALPDGTLAFVGRADRQVKLRGFRIELGEVEAALAAEPGVSAAAALLRQDAETEPRLVGYVTWPPGAPPPAEAALRASLRRKLPGYMMPAALVILPDLPLDPSGKIDLKALPPPGPRTAPTAPSPELPPLEEVLAGMMAEVLGVDRVGMDDRFFDLGGHSLRALELIGMVRQAFELEIPLSHLFDTPTVSGLAAYIREDPARSDRVEAAAAALLRLTAGERTAAPRTEPG